MDARRNELRESLQRVRNENLSSTKETKVLMMDAKKVLVHGETKESLLTQF